MTNRVYTSNIALAWPLERQLATVEGRGEMYQDRLSRAALKRRDPADLIHRATLLRSTARQGPETILVAALPCLAFTPTDLSSVLAAASARGATIVALDTGLTLPPDPPVSLVAEAIQTFTSAKRRAQIFPAREGFEVSRERRLALTQEGIDRIRKDWPQRGVSTLELRWRAGQGKKPMAYNTIIKHLGKRPKAQRDYDRAQDRLEERRRIDAI